MPKLSVLMIRAALLHLGVGSLFGATLLAEKGLPLGGWAWRLLASHAELMIFGGMMQFIMGVAFYALPRHTERTRRYGAERLAWWSFGLLNCGVVLAVLALGFLLPPLALLGRLLTLAGVLAYVRMIWPRVKPYAAP